MNFTQTHERLPLELVRRIQRGTLSVSLLARQTGFGQPHLSNFLHNRRQLSLEAINRVLAPQHMTSSDLLPVLHQPESLPIGGEWRTEFGPACLSPCGSHHAALVEPYIRATAAQSMLQLPAGALQSIRSRVASPRGAWQRFAAVRVPAADALPTETLVLPDATALLDRHNTSLMPYRPNRSNLYAVRHESHLTLPYVDFVSNRLVLRPHNIGFPVDLIEVDPGESPGDLLAGRVALILNEPRAERIVATDRLRGSQ